MPCSLLVLGEQVRVQEVAVNDTDASFIFTHPLRAPSTSSKRVAIAGQPNETDNARNNMDEDVLEVAYLPTLIPPSPQFPDSYENYRGRGTPLIIDNGATTLRFGFCTSDSPKFGPNIISKYKDRKSNKPLVLFGDAVDTEPGARNQAKTPWEGDILLNFDALVSAWSHRPRREDGPLTVSQENALDYAFVQLGIDTPNVDHPVMMTERLSSNLHSRACMSSFCGLQPS